MSILLALLALPSAAIADSRGSIENKIYSIPAPASPRKVEKCPRLDLHKAIAFGKLGCMLEATKFMDVNDRDVAGDTPLHNAVHAGNERAIRFLAKKGADIHLRDFQGLRPQELAENLHLHNISDYFLELERETERLQEAADSNDIVAVSNSLQRGASLGMRDIRLDTPLHKAAQSGLVEMGRLLVHHGAKLEARNYLGETALHQAALRDDYEFMQMLLEEGANPNAIDERRTTPYDIASLRADKKIMALMHRNRARPGHSASVEFDFEGGEGAIERVEGSNGSARSGNSSY